MAITVLLTCVQAFVSLIATAAIFLGQMDLSCIDECDYLPTVAAFSVMLAFSIATLLATIVGIGFRRLRLRNTIWIPSAGTAAIVAVFSISLWMQTIGA